MLYDKEKKVAVSVFSVWFATVAAYAIFVFLFVVAYIICFLGCIVVVVTMAFSFLENQENNLSAAENLCQRNNGVFRPALIGYDCVIHDQNKKISCSDKDTCYFE